MAVDGAAMPFPAALFDRVHHADVLCCLSAKRETLRECRRVARLGARMAFSVILLGRAPRDDGERALLQRSGPSHPDAECDYAELLRDAGWEPVECENVTAEFARCMDVLLAETAARHDALVALMGEQEAADRVVRRRSTREAVERGLLVRETFVAAARAVLDPA